MSLLPDITLYNTRTRKSEVFTPLAPGKVGMYVCGPTVYDRAHLGNARPVVVFDVLYRLLSTRYEATYVRNITDIDDKIMTAAKAKNIPIEEITRETTRFFHEEMAALKTLPPTFEPRATQHVEGMITFITKLIEKKHAYENHNHVLFDVTSLSSYGQLSRSPREDMIAGARIEVAPYKKNPGDFVLWKPSSVDQPGWESPWGRGRPGWHIECSAMSLALLGETFDIHGGGQDLLFPHHENECAQSTALCGEDTFAKLWMHNGILTVNGEKMSKSLGNFVTVQDLLAQDTGECLRFALLSTHYRHALDWTNNTRLQAKAALSRLYTALKGAPTSATSVPVDPAFLAALCDDLNTPAAIARAHEMASHIHKTTNPQEKEQLQKTLRACGALLGLLQEEESTWFQSLPEDLSVEKIEEKIHTRTAAKANKDYALADQIRRDLETLGILLEDTPQGTTWRCKT